MMNREGGRSMVWGFCVYFVPLETDVLRKHRFQEQFNQRFSMPRHEGLLTIKRKIKNPQTYMTLIIQTITQ